MKVTLSLLPLVATSLLSLAAVLPASARPAVLVAQEPGSQINVRLEPTTRARSPHYGVVGDKIEVLRSTYQRDGQQWNYVKFASGAQGWIRADYISYLDSTDRYAVLTGNPGDRINVRSNPSLRAASPSYGMQGDVVKVLDQTQASDGYIWQYVQFPTGTQGWVRGDLVQFVDEPGC